MQLNEDSLKVKHYNLIYKIRRELLQKFWQEQKDHDVAVNLKPLSSKLREGIGKEETVGQKIQEGRWYLDYWKHKELVLESSF